MTVQALVRLRKNPSLSWSVSWVKLRAKVKTMEGTAVRSCCTCFFCVCCTMQNMEVCWTLMILIVWYYVTRWSNGPHNIPKTWRDWIVKPSGAMESTTCEDVYNTEDCIEMKSKNFCINPTLYFVREKCASTCGFCKVGALFPSKFVVEYANFYSLLVFPLE